VLQDDAGDASNFKYPRNFLLQFQNIFTDKPDDLPNIEIIKGYAGGEAGAAPPKGGSRESKSGGKGSGQRRDTSRSGFKDSGSRQSHGRDRDSKHRKGGRRRSPPPSDFDGPVAPLEMSENRWKVGTIEDKEGNEIFKGKVRSILNKLTPEKFDRLFDQVLALGIDDGKILRLAIDEIFDKALGEVVFCSMYAELCFRLSEKLPEFVDEEGNKESFRRLLLNK
jgi:translation initiation factor 4G